MIYLLGLTAVAVSAVSGALTAGRRQMDAVGVLALALVTALGGGTLRDVLLGSRPLFWIQDTNYVWAAALFGLTTMLTARLWLSVERALLVIDALGLALFTAFGVQRATELRSPDSVVLLMGVVTGVAGGIFRDILANQVSSVFRKGPFYATASLGGGLLFLALFHGGCPMTACLGGCVGLALSLRLAALYWNLNIPVFSLPQPREDGKNQDADTLRR